MAMTRKHYREVAEIIADQVQKLEELERNAGADVTIPRECVEEIAGQLAGMFKRDNPAFNWQTFMEAAGLE